MIEIPPCTRVRALSQCDSRLDCRWAPSKVGAVFFPRCDLRSLATSSARSIRFAGTVIALIAGGLGVAGCASDCANNCPALAFNVVAYSGESLSIATATWTGDACATDQSPECRGNVDGSLPCVAFTIIAARPGTCRLDLTFTDGRAPFSATGTFGPATQQGCCQGFPVASPATATVPPLHPPVVVDAGSDGDGTAASDAAAD